MESEKVKILKPLKSWIHIVIPLHLSSVTQLNPLNKLFRPQFPQPKKVGDKCPNYMFKCNSTKH